MSDNSHPKKKATPSKKTPSKSTPAKKKAQASGSSSAQTGAPKKKAPAKKAAAKKPPVKKSVAKKVDPIVEDIRPADTEIPQTDQVPVSVPASAPAPEQTAPAVENPRMKNLGFWARVKYRLSR
jgi:hypothetical protein